MFTHNFKYALKTILKNKMLIFWTAAFPLVLALFFNMAFSNIEKSEEFKPIDIAIVNNAEFISHQELASSFASLDKTIFNITYTSLSKAESLLANNQISGYFLIAGKPQIYINQNGINETVFKQVTEEILKNNKIVEFYTNTKLATIKEEDQANFLNLQTKYLNEALIFLALPALTKDISSSHLSYVTIEYYTLIAMTCLYGATLSLYALNKCLANMSSKGKRISISPVKKSTIILSNALASFFVELLVLTILFLFTIFVLKVDYGSNLALVIVLAFLGAFAGMSLGIMVASVLKTNENFKTGFIIAFTMLNCFFAGMMGITMKYIIDKNIPLLNLINPANMITDGFYALYYYPTLNRYFINIISLVIFSALMLILSACTLRRQDYDSI